MSLAPRGCCWLLELVGAARFGQRGGPSTQSVVDSMVCIEAAEGAPAKTRKGRGPRQQTSSGERVGRDGGWGVPSCVCYDARHHVCTSCSRRRGVRRRVRRQTYAPRGSSSPSLTPCPRPCARRLARWVTRWVVGRGTGHSLSKSTRCRFLNLEGSVRPSAVTRHWGRCARAATHAWAGSRA